MDHFKFLMPDDAKKVGIDTHTVTYVYIYNYIQLSAHIVDVKPKTELKCEML